MVKELDTVMLTIGIPEHGFIEGDLGTAVHCYSDGNAYEVEFITLEGSTLAVLTLGLNDVSLMTSKEILHVREVARHAA